MKTTNTSSIWNLTETYCVLCASTHAGRRCRLIRKLLLFNYSKRRVNKCKNTQLDIARVLSMIFY